MAEPITGSDPVAEPPVVVERHGRTAVLRLNRPDRLNAIDRRVVAGLRAVVDGIAADPEVAAVVVTGAGRAFCAGADIAELSTLPGTEAFSAFLADLHDVLDRLERLPQPSIAAIGGVAYGGGCELALACDLRIMADTAALGVPEVKIGVLPGAGGTQRLPRLLPAAVARRMLLFGDPLPAADALHHGLVNALVAAGDVVPTALAWADRFADLPAGALATAKQLCRVASDTDLHSGLVAERHAVAALFDTADRREGMAAFLEKRAPTFRSSPAATNAQEA